MRVNLIACTQGVNGEEPVNICAQAAAKCYDSKPKASTVKQCIKSGHDSVIEHASFTFDISEVSRAFLAQLTRHRIASYSVRSQRYCSEDDFDYVLPLSIQKTEGAGREYNEVMSAITAAYGKLIALGIPKEDARYVLPNACCTSLIMTFNARSLRNLFKLRRSAKAQWEIRRVADAMFAEVISVAPELFEDMA